MGPPGLSSLRHRTHPRVVMGAYYPESTYCTRARFESGGFATCTS